MLNLERVELSADKNISVDYQEQDSRIAGIRSNRKQTFLSAQRRHNIADAPLENYHSMSQLNDNLPKTIMKNMSALGQTKQLNINSEMNLAVDPMSVGSNNYTQKETRGSRNASTLIMSKRGSHAPGMAQPSLQVQYNNDLRKSQPSLEPAAGMNSSILNDTINHVKSPEAFITSRRHQRKPIDNFATIQAMQHHNKYHKGDSMNRIKDDQR